MRNPIACAPCRTAKRQCIHHDARPPCDRCRALGRGDTCYFPPPGTSMHHRLTKSARRQRESGRDGGEISGRRLAYYPPSPGPQQDGEDGGKPSIIDPKHQGKVVGGWIPAKRTDVDLTDVNPYRYFTDEVKNSYLRCSYKWSFLHTPTLLKKVRKEEVEPAVIWAILALAIRFSTRAPEPFSTPIEASNTFAAHARNLLQLSLEVPDLTTIQTLLMITGHSWGSGDGQKAWMYLGLAVRMVQVLRLCEEGEYKDMETLTEEEFIESEERRRTAWTCFLMDSLLSGGKGRRRGLSADEMQVQLPCERDSFVFGEAVRTESLSPGCYNSGLSLGFPTGELGLIAYSMRVADIWGDVARWACSRDAEDQLPWDPDSKYQILTQQLEKWRSSLPHRLQYRKSGLHGHSALDQGQAYVYMHSIYFMSVMFLQRQYVPVLGPQSEQKLFPNYLAGKDDPSWIEWQRYSKRQLYHTAVTVCDMMEEIRSFGLFFLRGLVPWTGFTIYTAIGVMLYQLNFSDSEDDPAVTIRAKERVNRGCSFLREMKGHWPMADAQFETIRRMQAFYHKVQNPKEGVSPDERSALGEALVDYGAVQQALSPQASSSADEPSPLSEIQASAMPSPTGYQVSPPQPQSTSSPAIAKRSVSPPTQPLALDSVIRHGSTVPAMPILQPPAQQMLQPPDIIPTVPPDAYQVGPSAPIAETWPGDVNLFDFSNYDLEMVDFDTVATDATLMFWEDFPGQVEFSFQ
ncbi:hypothetical protein P152DRAFT_195648 [Eremomyces bilateralis CBS 781.70]|uniref:Zn(2)-C6 fungal-type domain-containing protein n=1 Tax=Eremomyces bilateralis CBS 781.70 TaxID=1392243 RepID=A0A6G1GCW8_9PEZI|nr:uncharacterized protein P152DRAFT_195648 [Eremomyces bilateralis CBS 781.70]KAF1815746.1 hypothetical protein P152DRAFT_195648 [Eremomyces bilateralis CBS 781.70]